MTKKKIILIILLIVLFIGASLTIYYLTKEDKKLNITGTVLISTEEYIIIESNNGDYIVNGIQNNYDVGDEITITYKESSMKDTTNPKEVTAIKEKLIKKDDDEEKEITNIDNETSNIIENTTKTEENTQNNTNNFNQSIIDNNSNTTNNNTSNNKHTNETTTTNDNYNNIAVKSADEEVLNYVNTLQNNAYQGITDTLKEGFITVVDFLFYNGAIAGHTFNELTTSAKLEVLKAVLFIDEKIDKYFPGYKETISNGMNKVYTTIKNLVVSTYLDITSNICENHNDLCASAKEGFQDLKKSFNFTWSFLKDLASSGLDKLKNWYEIWSGK